MRAAVTEEDVGESTESLEASSDRMLKTGNGRADLCEGKWFLGLRGFCHCAKRGVSRGYCMPRCLLIHCILVYKPCPAVGPRKSTWLMSCATSSAGPAVKRIDASPVHARSTEYVEQLVALEHQSVYPTKLQTLASTR
eukprot:3102575-Amphidinium_carterae.1